MTRKETISWLRRYSRQVRVHPQIITLKPFSKRDSFRRRNVYTQFIIQELIQMLSANRVNARLVIQLAASRAECFMNKTCNENTAMFLNEIADCLNELARDYETDDKRMQERNDCCEEDEEESEPFLIDDDLAMFIIRRRI